MLLASFVVVIVSFGFTWSPLTSLTVRNLLCRFQQVGNGVLVVTGGLFFFEKKIILLFLYLTNSLFSLHTLNPCRAAISIVHQSRVQ